MFQTVVGLVVQCSFCSKEFRFQLSLHSDEHIKFKWRGISTIHIFILTTYCNWLHYKSIAMTLQIFIHPSRYDIAKLWKRANVTNEIDNIRGLFVEQIHHSYPPPCCFAKVKSRNYLGIITKLNAVFFFLSLKI